MSAGSYSIILNSTNHVAGSTNRFEYRFPKSISFNEEDMLELTSLSMFNSIFNIEAIRGNNTFSIIWNANTAVQYNFTIPNGIYSIADLNSYIQSQCITNKLYMLNASSQYVFFVELVTNANAYASQINNYALPTTAEAVTLGYTIPAGASWTAPATASVPQIIITEGWGKLIGFLAQTLPTSVLAVDTSTLSSFTPQIQAVNAIILGCNLITNEYSLAQNAFYSFPLNVASGAIIDVKNNSGVGNSIRAARYDRLILEFYANDHSILRLVDFELTVVLNIKKKNHG